MFYQYIGLAMIPVTPVILILSAFQLSGSPGNSASCRSGFSALRSLRLSRFPVSPVIPLSGRSGYSAFRSLRLFLFPVAPVIPLPGRSGYSSFRSLRLFRFLVAPVIPLYSTFRSLRSFSPFTTFKACHMHFLVSSSHLVSSNY
jgi:hypothetical protein